MSAPVELARAVASGLAGRAGGMRRYRSLDDTVDGAEPVAGPECARRASPVARAGTREYLRIGTRMPGGTRPVAGGKAPDSHDAVRERARGATAAGDVSHAERITEGELALQRDGRLWRLGLGSLSIGRDAGSDIVVSAPRASRQHARIEVRNGRFVLTDQSSNGTFVQPAGADRVLVMREEYVLSGAGLIGFGDEVAGPGPNVIAYACPPQSDADGA
jgi:hypothetical protein